jgi:hypothetical protein
MPRRKPQEDNAFWLFQAEGIMTNLLTFTLADAAKDIPAEAIRAVAREMVSMNEPAPRKRPRRKTAQ